MDLIKTKEDVRDLLHVSFKGLIFLNYKIIGRDVKEALEGDQVTSDWIVMVKYKDDYYKWESLYRGRNMEYFKASIEETISLIYKHRKIYNDNLRRRKKVANSNQI